MNKIHERDTHIFYDNLYVFCEYFGQVKMAFKQLIGRRKNCKKVSSHCKIHVMLGIQVYNSRILPVIRLRSSLLSIVNGKNAFLIV